MSTGCADLDAKVQGWLEWDKVCQKIRSLVLCKLENVPKIHFWRFSFFNYTVSQPRKRLIIRTLIGPLKAKLTLNFLRTRKRGPKSRPLPRLKTSRRWKLGWTAGCFSGRQVRRKSGRKRSRSRRIAGIRAPMQAGFGRLNDLTILQVILRVFLHIWILYYQGDQRIREIHEKVFHGREQRCRYRIWRPL